MNEKMISYSVSSLTKYFAPLCRVSVLYIFLGRGRLPLAHMPNVARELIFMAHQVILYSLNFLPPAAFLGCFLLCQALYNRGKFTTPFIYVSLQ